MTCPAVSGPALSERLDIQVEAGAVADHAHQQDAGPFQGWTMASPPASRGRRPRFLRNSATRSFASPLSAAKKRPSGA